MANGSCGAIGPPPPMSAAIEQLTPYVYEQWTVIHQTIHRGVLRMSCVARHRFRMTMPFLFSGAPK
jgi:hypothetical protein